jgi:serine/threonine protein kinase/uncharacterized membrane protein affecting hemolysin expression
MSVGEIAAMTVVWVKEFSTNTFQRFSRNLFSIEFISRNRKGMAICLSIWLLANIAGYFIYRAEAARANDGLYQLGLSVAQNLATKSGPFVLEKDILSLNVAIRELDNVKDLKFAAIMDHENTILTHTDTEQINHKFEPSQHQKAIDKINDITIIGEISSHETKIIGFSKDIIFGGVDIGKVYIAVSAAHLYQTLNRLKFIYLSGVLVATLLLVIVLFWLDRTAKAKTLKIREDIESTNRFGPYLLHKKVARGGMAELFLSDYIREDGFRRKVAVKRILPHLSENPDFIKMFAREARLAALLNHPNIVQIFDYGKIDKAYFIAMEYIDGKDLGEILSNLGQGLPIENAVFIMTEICKGLDYSHTRVDDHTGEPLKIVHRDISPQNMLISYQGEVKISDFGISKARSEPSFTQAGVIKGKLSYLSTEQALGKPVDNRADIYSLGLVFYETLTGERVYRFSSDVEAIRAIPRMEIEPLIKSRPQVPEELNRIVMKCLEKSKDSRYESASALYADLIAFKKGLKITFDDSDLADFMKKNFKEGGNFSNTKEPANASV